MKRKHRLQSSDRNTGDNSDNSPGVFASKNLLKPSNFKHGPTARPVPKKQLSFRASPTFHEHQHCEVVLSESEVNSSEHEQRHKALSIQIQKIEPIIQKQFTQSPKVQIKSPSHTKRPPQPHFNSTKNLAKAYEFQVSSPKVKYLEKYQNFI